ncbi:transporter substrate-binding domain-containing protein [Pelomonas sp. SE-A7]|uniref:substrate-binding periplasmic protein n=1 Tax=Pelomonas sp. SE-A7 TaxID=3054953 RepID=UPI00259D2BF8|nr:transporter substrate-binding domain-containing protein [Pelomonas sp. SE-A7]MDM4768419.1 transporter substrate-binding domain-containing protein [Pelomonas sp. SE-A7]
MRCPGLACLICLALLLPAARAADELLAVSEDAPPFAYLDNGRFLGLANELLDRIAQRSGLRLQRSQQPWARAQQTVRQLNNSLLYVTVRTPARESQYRWVGPIDDCDIVVMALATSGLSFDPRLPSVRQLRIGAVRGSPAAQLLREAGVAERAIYVTPGSETSTKMLYAGHLDMIAGLILPYAHQASRLGLDGAQLGVIHQLQKGYGCYYAFNPAVDDQVFERFAKAFESLRAEGELKSLRARYFRSPSK